MKPEIKKHGYETFSAPHMKKDLVKWIDETFEHKPTLEKQKFNVSCYTKAEKELAIMQHNVEGVFKCQLDTTGNSLIVERI